MKNYFILSALASVAMYLMVSFVLWDITCITRLPSLDEPSRGCLLGLYLSKEVAIYFWWDEMRKKKKGEEDGEK